MSDLPKCRVCGHEDHWLGDHLAEAHGITVDAYLTTFPGAPTLSQRAFDELEGEGKNKRRQLPPEDTELTVDIYGFTVKVNPDVPAEDCLPMPDGYRFPKHGDLAVDCKEASIAILRNRPLFIHGQTGTGKDALIHAICHICRIPSFCKQILPGEDIQGWFYSRAFDAVGTKWELGEVYERLVEGYTTTTGRVLGYTALFSDFDRGTKGQMEHLRLVMDTIEGRVGGPKGTTEPICKGTQILITANTAGGGDTRGRMVSTNPIDAALFNRITRKLRFHWLDWLDEEPIVRGKFPYLYQRCPDAFAQLGEATSALREAIYKDTLFWEFSHRDVCGILEHMLDIAVMEDKVPKDLLKRGFRVFLDGAPDEQTRLEAERLIDPKIKGGVLGVDLGDSGTKDPLGGFSL